MPADTHPLWTRLTAELRQMVPATTFDIWLAPLRWGGIEGETIVVLAPPEAHCWVEDRFLNVLRAAAARAIGNDTPPALVLRYADAPHGSEQPASRSGDSAQRPAAKQAQVGPATPAEPAFRRQRLHPKYTFEQFVIGAANRLAHGAALAAAEQPGATFNPIFFVGPPGTGKTHLLHSIGNYVEAFGGGLSVRYTTAEDFTNDFLGALDRRSVAPFKHHYRHADVLLIDDVQFLAGKTATCEELFHTFNTLRDAGSQIVLSADCHPREMRGLEERLCQRFESGLLIDIDRPDDAMRRTVVRMRATLDGVALDDQIAEMIAARITSNVRALEAALIRISAYSSISGEPITVELAERVLDQLYGRDVRRQDRTPSIGRIQELVAEAFDLTVDELLSGSRTARITWPRQVAMFLAREHSHASLPAIGTAFGGRDHTTVLHACKRVTERLESEPEIRRVADEIMNRLAGSDRAC